MNSDQVPEFSDDLVQYELMRIGYIGIRLGQLRQ